VAEAESNGRLAFIDSGEMAVYALDPENGSTVWRSDFHAGTAVDMLVTEKYLYASNGAALSVYDAESGTLFTRALASSRSATPQVFGSAGTASDRHVFITLSSGAWSFAEP
jgi:outer membrane protein assembly factor BamB